MSEAASGAVAIRPPTDLALREWDQQYRELVKRTVLKPKNREATNVELALFAEQVQRTQLNPFIGQIYAIYRWDSRAGDEVMQVQVGIDGFRIVAERTGKYEGQSKQEWCDKDGNWHDAWLSDAKPHAARVGVYKKGRREATYAVAHWKEYVQDKGLWKSMPANQIAKCAEALALRKAFPAELSGLYTPDEAARRATEQDITDVEGAAMDAPPVVELAPAVEAIVARASTIGYAPLANRAAVAMAVDGQPDEFVASWCSGATRDLNRYAAGKAEPEPVDADVVDPDTQPQPPPAQQPISPEGLGVSPWIRPGSAIEHAPPTADEQAAADKLGVGIVSQGFLDEGPPRCAEPQQPIDAVITEGDAAERIEALRARALTLLDEADGLDAAGDERGAEVREEAEKLMDQVDAAQGQEPEQGSLGL